jgi:tetratricopeptide (TPR) repeat protein
MNQKKRHFFTRSIRNSFFICFILFIPTVSFLLGDVIHLKNGNSVQAEKVWREGNQICYENEGSSYRFSQTLVDKIESGKSLSTLDEKGAGKSTHSDFGAEIDRLSSNRLLEPNQKGATAPRLIINDTVDLRKLQEIELAYRRQSTNPEMRLQYLGALAEIIEFQLKHEEQEGAIENLNQFITLEPDHLQASLILSSLYLKQGQYSQVENLLTRLQVRNSNSSDLHYLLGASYYLQEKNELASRELKLSLKLKFNAEVQALLGKIEGENRAENNFHQANSLHFVIRFEGTQTNQALGNGILECLERSYQDLERVLNYSPRENIAVILYPNEVFQDVTQAPHWAGALNDGKIRIPLIGVSRLDRHFEMVLKHELTHSFIRLKSGGACPVWLNEGLAQYLTGASARPMIPRFKQAALLDQLVELKQMESSFVSLSPQAAVLAYQESLLAVEYLAEVFGLETVVRLLEEAMKTGGFERSMRSVLQKDYAELQKELQLYIQQK